MRWRSKSAVVSRARPKRARRRLTGCQGAHVELVGRRWSDLRVARTKQRVRDRSAFRQHAQEVTNGACRGHGIVVASGHFRNPADHLSEDNPFAIMTENGKLSSSASLVDHLGHRRHRVRVKGGYDNQSTEVIGDTVNESAQGAGRN